MPLYIKLIEFFDRDYHYQQLAEEICRGSNSDKDKALALFEWTNENIKTDIPQDWPIVDDHVWHIIVRGYGVADQCSDVFSTLCNYAGVDAFFTYVSGAKQTQRISLSFVKLNDRWSIFDPFRGCYFKNKDGEPADIEEIRSGDSWSIVSLNGKPNIDYAVYFAHLPSVKDVGLNRANIQSPRNRLFFELQKVKERY